jgi:hypothetical protein
MVGRSSGVRIPACRIRMVMMIVMMVVMVVMVAVVVMQLNRGR